METCDSGTGQLIDGLFGQSRRNTVTFTLPQSCVSVRKTEEGDAEKSQTLSRRGTWCHSHSTELSERKTSYLRSGECQLLANTMWNTCYCQKSSHASYLKQTRHRSISRTFGCFCSYCTRASLLHNASKRSFFDVLVIDRWNCGIREHDASWIQTHVSHMSSTAQCVWSKEVYKTRKSYLLTCSNDTCSVGIRKQRSMPFKISQTLKHFISNRSEV